jgi:peptidoglycan/LPS O-acetylase OafA/YrhL
MAVFSYGTYLYAFPIEELVVHLAGHAMARWLLFTIATPVPLVLAPGSWYGVDRHFLVPVRSRESPIHAGVS